MLRGYSLRKNEAVHRGVRRVLGNQLSYAVSRLDNLNNDPDVSVHEFRKCMKRIRALLRLLRNETGYYQYRTYNTAFRDASRELSKLRDMAVLLSLSKGMGKAETPLIDPVVSGILVNHFRQQYREQKRILLEDENLHNRVKESIRQLESLPEKLQVIDPGFTAVEGGLLRIYRRGRKAMYYAREFPLTENFHELRKRVKDLWHASQLLYHAWPDAMILLSHVLREASEVLGTEHDLAVLQEEVKELDLPGLGPARRNKTLRQLQSARNRLQTTILQRCSLIYTETPAAFTRRIGLYWHQNNSSAPAPLP